MNRERVVGSSVVLIVLSLSLFPYQNCAPSKASSQNQSDPELRLIDQYSQEKIAFAENVVVTQSSVDEVNFDGLCSQQADDTLVNWALEDIDKGLARCERGGFRISAKNLLDMECGREYQLVARSLDVGEGVDAVLRVLRKCSPVAIELVDSKESQFSLNECFKELNREGAIDLCSLNCYTDFKEVSRQKLPVDSCAKL